MYVQPPNPDVGLGFIRDILGMQPWEKQTEIVRSVFGPVRTTAVFSANSMGKTTVAAAIALAWLYTHPGRIVITSAPTQRQVRRLLWKELRKLYRGARQPLGGRMPPEACTLQLDEGWGAIGFASNDPVNFQGEHAPAGVLVILDEANGIDQLTYDALKGIKTGDNDRVLMIGNPVTPEGPFFDARKMPGVNKIWIDALDSPNVKAGRTIIHGLATQAWVDEVRADWGEDSPQWTARVRGQFPELSEDSLVPLVWLDLAEQRWLERTEKGHWSDGGWDDWNMGLDVSRLGAASTIAALSNHFGIRALVRGPKTDTFDTALWIRDMQLALGAGFLSPARELPKGDPKHILEWRIDGDGLGIGVVDAARRINEISGLIREMRGGMPAMNAAKFANSRAEWAWGLRERLDPSRAGWPGHGLALPPDRRLLFQLHAIRWKHDLKGRVALEQKRDLKARLPKVGSPDEMDAVMMSLAGGGFENAVGEGLGNEPAAVPMVGHGPWGFPVEGEGSDGARTTYGIIDHGGGWGEG